MTIKVGEVETIDFKDKRPAKPNVSTGKGTGGGSGRRGGGGGGGGGDRADSNDSSHEFQPQKYRIGMWMLLGIVLMTFTSLIGIYVVLALNQQLEWRPIDVPVFIWFSTIAILLSSVTYELLKKSQNAEKFAQARRYLWITTALGLIFIIFQSIAWKQLADNPELRGSSYVGLFYVLTVIHAAHVLGGIIALFYMLWRTRREPATDESVLKRKVATSFVGGYWHTVDGLWLILLGLLVYFK